MKLHFLAALGLLLTTGCSGGSWMKAPTLPFGQKRASESESFSAMVSRRPGSTQTTEKSGSGKKKTPETGTLSAVDFLERMAAGRAAEQSSKWEPARDIYQKLIVDYPDRPEPYHRLGVVADRQQRHREAQSLYTQSLQRKPDNAEAFNDLGYCFFLQGQLGKAESALMKAVSLSPAEGRFRNNLGMVLGHLGRHEEALAQFRHAGSEADAQYNLAFVQLSREQLREARQRLELALRNDPRHPQARLALDELTAIARANQPDGGGVVRAGGGYGPQAAQAAGRYVPYLEEFGDSAAPGSLTGGVTEMGSEAGEGGNIPAGFHQRHGAGTNAAVRALQGARFDLSEGYTVNDGHTEAASPQMEARIQAIQSQARAMMEARLHESP